MSAASPGATATAGSRELDPSQVATKRPGFMVGLVAATHTAVFGAAAWTLPYEVASSFSLAAGAMALGHGLLAVATWSRRPQARSIWRFMSVAAIAFLGAWAYLATSAGVYLARLYGGLGEGLAVATAAAFTPVVLFTLPFAFWGLAATRKDSKSRGLKAAAALALIFVGGGLVEACASAAPQALDRPDAMDERDPYARAEALGGGLSNDAAWVDSGARGRKPRLYTMQPVQCERPLDAEGAPDVASAIVTYLPKQLPEKVGQGGASRALSACIQADEDDLLAQVDSFLASEVAAGPIKVDIITARARLDDAHPLVDGLKLRPGLDGACIAGRCLMPWQLVAADQFTKFVPVPFIADLRVGFDPRALAELLAIEDPQATTVADVTRLETASFWIDASGAAHPLVRGREPMPRVDARTTLAAVAAAEAYILSAQIKDGRFRYKLDPFTGKIDRNNYNMPRQAGTTLALCELGTYEPKVDTVVERSLDFMARRARPEAQSEQSAAASGEAELVFLTKSAKAKKASLGGTALPLIAFAVCRDRVGERFDAFMGGMARALLAMQREDGGFVPLWDRRAHAPLSGPEPLFAEGQVIFALSAMEGILRKRVEQGQPVIASWPSAERLHEAVDAAMDHYSGPYWDHALAQFFWIEENWHCLAARASLKHHRHDAYERFCLDYVRYKHRLSLDADSRVSADFLGGYGFGNLIAPHNTGTAGYGEALAAAIAIARARGESTQWMEDDLLAAHTFLLRQQWSAANDFATVRAPLVRGGFSESMSSPVIRIDYVQHAMAALGHGASMLYDGDGRRVEAR